MTKIDILMIHGGMTFKSQEDYINYLKTKPFSLDKKTSWNCEWFENQMGSDYRIIKPRFPLQDNAKYEDWKIVFERYVDLLENDVILIGWSLGGIFLAKWLSENKFPKKLISVYMICPPFRNDLPSEDLVGGFELGVDLTLIEKNCSDVKLMFSKDDDVVPIEHAQLYREKLSECEIIIYENKGGHFRIEEFPEIVEMIRKDL